MRYLAIIALVLILIFGGFIAFNSYINNESQGDIIKNTNVQAMDKKSPIIPITHATMILNMGDTVIYNDPTGNATAFEDFDKPNIILISDIHGDHMDPETLTAVSTKNTTIILPQAVKDVLPGSIPGTMKVMKNGDTIDQDGITITAIPMYNIPESADAFHTKGRGNGYVLEAHGQKIYIAGDTGPIPEMKALQNIDTAFIPMNLPYTMSVEDAAEAVLAFKPKTVIPYHYRGENGLSDTNKFKELVNAGDPNITVTLLNFYPKE